MTACPFKNNKNDSSMFGDKKTENSSSKCPFSDKPIVETIKNDEKKVDKKAEKTAEENEISSDEDKDNQGGCPVLNKTKKDPLNKHYEPSYEISRFGPYDFIFDLRGGLSRENFLEQTKIIRKYPRHMKYSLFHNDEKINKIRTKEFPLVFFVYDEVKEKGNKLFKKRKYRESIDYYIYAYSMLKWIEFIDTKKKAEFLSIPSLDPVLDVDIKECKAFLDDVAVEEDSYNACVVFLLMCLSNSYMELRHYSEAIDCLDECISIAGDKISDLYFRRSQVRTYNKCSNDEDLRIANSDIEKAISLKKEKIYFEHKEKLTKIIEDKKSSSLEKIEKLIQMAKFSLDKIKERGLKIEECIFTRKEDQVTQYKVLKEMESKYHSAIKFFTETKNEEQLNIAYKEIENFMETYENFLFYYTFNPNNINNQYYESLSQDVKNLLKDEKIILLINEHRYKIADDKFGNGNYNFALYKYALEKVCEDDRKVKEETERKLNESRPKVSFFENYKNSNLYFFISLGIIFFTVFISASSYYFSQGYSKILNK